MKLLLYGCVGIIAVSMLMLTATLFYSAQTRTEPGQYLFYGIHRRFDSEPEYFIVDTVYSLKQGLPYNDCLEVMESTSISMEAASYESNSMWVIAVDDRGFFIEDPLISLRCYV